MKDGRLTAKKITALSVWLVSTLVYVFYRATVDVPHAVAQTVHTAGVVLLLVYAVAFLLWIGYTKKYASIFFVFLVFCFLFNAGQILLGLFDTTFVSEVNIYHEYSSTAILKMILFQCDCVLALMLGAILAYKESPSSVTVQEDSPLSGKTALTFTDIIFLLVTALLAVSYLREVVQRGGASYGDYYYGDREGISVPLLFFYHVSMYKVLVDHERDVMSKIAFLINIIMAALMLMVGSRNAILQIIFGSLFILFYVRRQPVKLSFGKKIVVAVVAVVGILFMTGVQSLRQYSLSQLNWDVVAQVYGDGLWANVEDALAQMGGSARCIIVTQNRIDLGAVESEQTILYTIVKAFIPVNILDFLHIEQPIYQSLSAWVSATGGTVITLENPSGWGYSIFAEAYYDFKAWGFLYLFVWGFAFVWLEQKVQSLIRRERVWEGCALLYVLAYGIFIARADSNLLTTRTRYCFYVFVLCYLIRQFTKPKKSKIYIPRGEG